MKIMEVTSQDCDCMHHTLWQLLGYSDFPEETLYSGATYIAGQASNFNNLISGNFDTKLYITNSLRMRAKNG